MWQAYIKLSTNFYTNDYNKIYIYVLIYLVFVVKIKESRVYRFLFRSMTRIQLRPKLSVKILYFDHENQVEAEPIIVKGVCFKDPEGLRKLMKFGDSQGYTIPIGWGEHVINKEKYSNLNLILTEEKEYKIMISLPKEGKS